MYLLIFCHPLTLSLYPYKNSGYTCKTPNLKSFSIGA